MKLLKRYATSFAVHYDHAFVAEYVRRHCAEEAREVIRQADLLLRNTFVFTDRWDMEPCPIPYQMTLDTWVDTPNGDPEWVFMLNRHDFLNKLWLAYSLTGDRAYTDQLLFFIRDWIQKNPITPEGMDATRTIDTGIRCMNWINLLMHLLSKGLLSDEDAELIIHSLNTQYRNMCCRYIGKYALSNWGVLQTTAICAGSVWLSNLPEELVRWSWEELRTQLRLQILGDGSHWEQSAMYHVEVLNTCVKLLAQLRFAERIGKPLHPLAVDAIDFKHNWTDELEASALPGEGFDPDSEGWLLEAVRILSRHVLHTADPSFLQLPQCDSDVTDVRDVMCRAASLLTGSGVYRFAAGEQMDLESAWLLGSYGIRGFLQAVPLPPSARSWNCSDSGTISIRSGWNADAMFIWLKNGTLGSSHGHADQTHLTLYHKGKPFLIDSGRYTYLEEDPLRVLLKSPCAHNVCVIDAQSGGKPNGSWNYHKYDETLKNYFFERGDIHYAEMAFHGCLDDGTPYLITRKILAIDEGICLSVQDIICQGKHQIMEYFHLDSAVSVKQTGNDLLLFSGDAALRVHTSHPLLCRSGVVSKKYNEKEDAPILLTKQHMCDRLTTFAIFTDAAFQVKSVPVYQMRNPEPVSDGIASAWDVLKPDGTKRTLIVWNRETYRGDKLYTCHGRSVYGKALVLTWEGDSCRMTRLKT